MLLLHQITNDFVVEILNGSPLNILPFVFILFLLQNQFYEQLLEFFVAVVYTELFKTVDLEDFETINIQDADDGIFAVDWTGSVCGRFQGFVDLLDDPTEKPIIDGLKPQKTVMK